MSRRLWAVHAIQLSCSGRGGDNEFHKYTPAATLMKKEILLEQCVYALRLRLNPLNAELNPICPLLEFFGAHHIFHVSRIRVNVNNHESNQQDATIQVILLFLVNSTCLGRCFRPSSGALDYLQYLVVFTQVATGCHLAATWVNTTRYCKYSRVLLMMGENIARNM
jgi:hypothetical protein